MKSWSHPRTTQNGLLWFWVALGGAVVVVLFKWDALRPNASIDLDVWMLVQS